MCTFVFPETPGKKWFGYHPNRSWFSCRWLLFFIDQWHFQALFMTNSTKQYDSILRSKLLVATCKPTDQFFVILSGSRLMNASMTVRGPDMTDNWCFSLSIAFCNTIICYDKCLMRISCLDFAGVFIPFGGSSVQPQRLDRFYWNHDKLTLNHEWSWI